MMIRIQNKYINILNVYIVTYYKCADSKIYQVNSNHIAAAKLPTNTHIQKDETDNLMSRNRFERIQHPHTHFITDVLYIQPTSKQTNQTKQTNTENLANSG